MLTHEQVFSLNLNHALSHAGIPSRGRPAYIQKRLSEHVSVTAVRKWLSYEALPDPRKLPELAAIAQTTIDALFNEATAQYLFDAVSGSGSSDHIMHSPSTVVEDASNRLRDFHVVVGTPSDVSIQVTERLHQGWELAGNLAVGFDSVGNIKNAAQPLTRNTSHR